MLEHLAEGTSSNQLYRCPLLYGLWTSNYEWMVINQYQKSHIYYNSFSYIMFCVSLFY